IQIMFAVRKALSHPDNLRAFTDALVEKGQIDPADLDAFPDFLLAEAPSLPDAAYRFCRDEPGVHVVLSGTGNADHLDANLASFARPPLTQETRDRLIHIFRRVNSTTGQAI
ncbi:MAG: aldo/keto reductase, partial [Gemmatimonadota bacterium]|nr:aldo/keto reductase [Gemmatimonadota bacterium]